MFASNSSRVAPWLKTPGTCGKRPTHHGPSFQYSSWKRIDISGWWKRRESTADFIVHPSHAERPFLAPLPLLEGAWTRRVYRPSPQLDLLAPVSPRREYDLKLASVIDGLRRHHGAAIIRRGDELLPKTA